MEVYLQYQINIRISPSGLQQIYAAGQSVSLARTPSTAPNGFPIVWLTFQPFELNQVIWNEDYSIYATGTPLTPGSVITMNSQTEGAAQPGWSYLFRNGIFEGQRGAGSSYSTSNQMNSTNPLAFGLAQAANVNGVNVLAPVNGVPLPVHEEAKFTPVETVSIFLSSAGNGTIINSLPNNVLTIHLTAENPIANVTYDDSTDSFKLVSNNLAPAAPAGETPKIGVEFARSHTAV
jgi:hypothetical protein